MKFSYILPYVDSTKEKWKKLFNQYKKLVDINVDFNNRFFHNILFKYQFRGIERFMPWIDDLILVMMDEDQVPDWINKNNVRIIYHKDFIPSKYLPLFNCNIIENFMWNIPDLEECFFYSNDDFYVTNTCFPTDFFDEFGHPLNTNKERIYIGENRNFFGRMVRREFKLVKDEFGLDYPDHMHFRPAHNQEPFSKSFCRETYYKYKDIIDNSITRFRDESNITQHFFLLRYIYYTNQQFVVERSTNYLDGKNVDGVVDYLINNDIAKLTCINDSTPENDIIYDKIFKSKFPKKSKYEN